MQRNVVSIPSSGRSWLRLVIGKVRCIRTGTSDREIFDLDGYTFKHKFAVRGGRYLFLLRDPRDLLVSSYHQYKYRPSKNGADVGTAITYQGQLKESGVPATGSYDFIFTLYDNPNAGSPVGDPCSISEPNVPVTNGLFSSLLDYGSNAFDGDARWLEIQVRPYNTGEYTTLSPRPEITPAPYAIYSMNGGSGGTGGNGTTNYIPKFTDPDTLGNSVIYENNGQIGIGTINPAAKLTINGAILRDGSTMYGTNAYTHINLGTSSTTGRLGI